MPLTAKSAHDLERQKIFEYIRHEVGNKHQVPEHLNCTVLTQILLLLRGINNEQA